MPKKKKKNGVWGESPALRQITTTTVHGRTTAKRVEASLTAAATPFVMKSLPEGRYVFETMQKDVARVFKAMHDEDEKPPNYTAQGVVIRRSV